MLEAGANPLVITATSSDGLTATQSLTVTSTADNPVELQVDKDNGMAPHDVIFSLKDNTGASISSIEYDVDNDGIPEYSTGDPNATFPYTYTTPGCYTARVTVTDDATNTYTATQTIAVQDVDEVKNQVTAVYYRMLEKFRIGSLAEAMNGLTETMKGKYEAAFNALSPTDLTAYIDNIGTVVGGRFMGDTAEITVVRDEDGTLKAFPVFVIKEKDGVWRIGGM